VLLHGPAGVGKTALAAASAAGYAELPGGVVWFDVRGDSMQSLIARVARAYAADSLVDVSDRSRQASIVKTFLQQDRPLIVLDGEIEADAVRGFIRECAPSIPLLFTHLRMVAGSWTPHPVAPLPPEYAEAMLRYHAKLPSENGDREQLDGLLNILSGYPIAIKTAGIQIAAQDDGLEAFLAKLPKLPPGEPNRVMGVLMAAYRLLPKDLQGLLLVLGTTFTGGASLELLAAVGKAPDQVIAGKMRQLVERGFAREHVVYGQPYFSTHELITTFAQTFLRGKKQLDAMQDRHLNSLLTYIESQVGDDFRENHDRLSAEMRNILAACVFAAQNDQVGAVSKVVELFDPALPDSFIVQRGYQLEHEWLRRLTTEPDLADAGILGEREPSAEALPEIQPDITPARPAEDQAEPTVEMAGATWPPSPDAGPEPTTEPEAASVVSPTDVPLPRDAEALQKISEEYVESGEADQAIAQYAQAVNGYKADGNIEDELAAIEALAQLSLESDQYEDVLKYVEQGTALAQEADNPQREGELLVVLGDLQMSLGQFDGAETAYKEAINAFRPTEAWLNIGLALNKLAVVYDDQGRWQDAIDVWEQTLPIFERLERPDLLRDVYGEIGDNQTDLMRWNQAKASYTKALELAEAADDEAGMYQELSRLGWLMETSGQHAEAISYYRRALNVAFELDDQDELGETLLALARLQIDDTSQLNRVVQLLEMAQDCLPGDSDVRRLLSRANTRKERLTQAGVDLPPVEDSLEDYASAVSEDG
jgi:tetratricopeptide (TPR) repeat protein